MLNHVWEVNTFIIKLCLIYTMVPRYYTVFNYLKVSNCQNINTIYVKKMNTLLSAWWGWSSMKHCIALHCTKTHYTKLHYTIMHYTTPSYAKVTYTKLHYTTMLYTLLHYTKLYYTSPLCTALLCLTLLWSSLYQCILITWYITLGENLDFILVPLQWRSFVLAKF